MDCNRLTGMRGRAPLFRRSIRGCGPDCAHLLAVRNTLAGEVRLNWSRHLPLDAWDGVTVDGWPERVTKLELPGWGPERKDTSRIGTIATSCVA